MLLSMYVAYRLERSVQLTRAHMRILETLLFVLPFSVFSAIFPGYNDFFPFSFALIYFPSYLSWLSFPFYSWNLESGMHERYGGISFFAIDMTSTPVQEYYGSLELHSFVSFTFFLVCNILGAWLGYSMGKKRSAQSFSSKRLMVLCGLVGAVSVGLCFVPGISSFIGKRVLINLFGFGIFSFDIIVTEIVIILTEQSFLLREPKELPPFGSR